MNENFLTIKSVPSNKTEQQALASRFIEAVKNGDINPVDAVVQMKSMSDTISNFLKDSEIKDAVIAECQKYGRGEKAQYKGAVVDIKESGTKWNYSECGDIEWDDLNSQIEALTEKRKKREIFLKALEKRTTLVNDETGEVWDVIPPTRTSTTSFSVTFRK